MIEKLYQYSDECNKSRNEDKQNKNPNKKIIVAESSDDDENNLDKYSNKIKKHNQNKIGFQPPDQDEDLEIQYEIKRPVPEIRKAKIKICEISHLQQMPTKPKEKQIRIENDESEDSEDNSITQKLELSNKRKKQEVIGNSQENLDDKRMPQSKEKEDQSKYHQLEKQTIQQDNEKEQQMMKLQQEQFQVKQDESEYYSSDASNQYLNTFIQYCEPQNNLKDILKALIELQEQIMEYNFKATQITPKINLQVNQIQLQTNARKRIKHDVEEFYKNQLQNIYLFKIIKDGAILQHAFIIIMKGGDKQYINQKNSEFIKNFENGYFSFYLEFPENYPFSTPTFRSLLPIKHPHIYPDNRVCIPLIDYHSIVQNYSILNLLKSQYDILHSMPNERSIANYDVFEQYDEEFIKLQCQFLSEHNLIYKSWNIFQQIEQFQESIDGPQSLIINL